MTNATFLGSYETWVVTCPKHGEHNHVISSTVKGYEGHWCQLCWLEMLGEPLPAVFKRVPYEDKNT
jgi:hypothetical protein